MTQESSSRHIVYSVRGDTRYATVMRTIRDGNETRKEMIVYLGRELDEKQGIYKNKARGIFTYNLKTNKYDSAPASFVDVCKRKNAREELIVNFGDAFLFDSLIHKFGISTAIDAIGYGNTDSLYGLLLYYMLCHRSNNAQTWYEGSYARFLYPKANLSSQRISDLLAGIGREDSYQRFFGAYLPLLGEEVRQGANILIHSTGLPNSIQFPLTTVSNHNGQVSEEVRLIYVAQQGSRMSIYMRYVPGSIIDASTLVTTDKELKAVGVNTKFSILDAGYLTEAGMHELYRNKISFLTRCPTNRKAYKEVMVQHLPDLERAENLALESQGHLFNGRQVYIKCVPVENYFGMKLYAYVGKDRITAMLEGKKYSRQVHSSRQHVDRKQFQADLDNHGAFMILSTRRIKCEDLLSTYYVQQEVEQVFDITKNYASLLPLNVEKKETFRGHLLLTFMATVILQKLQSMVKES
ncbi:MAG TPA: hypothetical protein IAC66_02595 [Candidatus Aphodousia gallistercoris]|nr:hypothetical protein [Candidatus Aphodousia gallistercoris]